MFKCYINLVSDIMRLLLSQADMVNYILLEVAHRSESHNDLVQFIGAMLTKKCISLFYTNTVDPITLIDAEKILKVKSCREKYEGIYWFISKIQLRFCID